MNIESENIKQRRDFITDAKLKTERESWITSSNPRWVQGYYIKHICRSGRCTLRLIWYGKETFVGRARFNIYLRLTHYGNILDSARVFSYIIH